MGAEDYRRYAFADGGYLDNKPFTHATDQLGRRRADVPVERKLIYIEPDPSGDLAPNTPAAAAEDRPDVFENIAAAVTKLPRTETIREDVDAVVRRSRAVARLRAVTGKVTDAAATSMLMGGAEVSTLPGESDSIAYTELRRQNVLDDLADVVASVVGIPDGSDGQHALRLVASAWAELRGIESDELFARYDLGFRLRRLSFVQHRINDLIAGVGGPSEVASDLGLWYITAESAARLRQIKLALNEIFVELRWRARGVRYPERTAEVLEADRIAHGPGAVPVDPDSFRAVADAVAATGLTEQELVARVLDPGNGLVRSEAQASGRAAELAGQLGPQLDALANTLAEIFDLPFRSEHAAAMLVLGGGVTEGAEAQEEARKWLLRPGEPESEPPRLLHGLVELPEPLRNLLRWYYEAFVQVDALFLPLTYPDLVEVNPVDVIRISPLDAKSLIDETGSRRRKLAGASVHHFGGFFDEGFRVNDILWGRLDRAERIIETALPAGHKLKGFFVEAAQLGIIAEDVLGEPRPAWVAEAIRKHSPASPRSEAKAAELLDLLGEGWTDERLAEALAVREHLATRFIAPTEKDRRKTLDVIGRGTSITSDVLRAEADRSQSALKPIFWAGRLGRIVAGLAALATRPSAAELPRMVFRNIVVLALALGALLIIFGFLGVEGVAKAGWTIAIVTAIAQLAVWLATAWVGAAPRRPGARSKKRFLRGVIAMIVALTVVLAAIGAFHVVDRIVDRLA